MRHVPAIRRPARLLPATALAVALLLGACGGGGAASQGDVKRSVAEQLTERGFVAGTDVDPVPLTEGQATDAAECISGGLFDTERFTEDERGDVTSAGDGAEPDPELAGRFQALVAACVEEVLAAGPVAPDQD